MSATAARTLGCASSSRTTPSATMRISPGSVARAPASGVRRARAPAMCRNWSIVRVSPRPDPGPTAARILSMACGGSSSRRQGEHARARLLVDEEVELARRWGAPRPLGAALRVAGLVEGGPAGVDLLRDSVDTLASSPALLERAKSLTELAALRRANHRVEARGFLTDALELALRLADGKRTAS